MAATARAAHEQARVDMDSGRAQVNPLALHPKQCLQRMSGIGDWLGSQWGFELPTVGKYSPSRRYVPWLAGDLLSLKARSAGG
jgi:hypothetical protein